jgi:hypothetical protein
MIENIVLSRDHRGISALRPYLPPEFCHHAAALLLENPGTVLIATGFFIPGGGATETDGPPGAVTIGQALEQLGRRVVYVSDSHTVPLLRALAGDGAHVIEFPHLGHEESKRHAAHLLDEVKPDVALAIERCGLTDEGLYRNMRGVDVSAYHAKLDYLFTHHPCSIGIGDGGNEIGMGNLAPVIPLVTPIVGRPCATRTTRLVIASVSNWGAWGIVAALSLKVGRWLLPSVGSAMALLERTVELGAVDGVTGKVAQSVDGFPFEENQRVLEEMEAWLLRHGVNASAHAVDGSPTQS